MSAVGRLLGHRPIQAIDGLPQIIATVRKVALIKASGLFGSEGGWDGDSDEMGMGAIAHFTIAPLQSEIGALLINVGVLLSNIGVLLNAITIAQRNILALLDAIGVLLTNIATLLDAIGVLLSNIIAFIIKYYVAPSKR